MLGLDNAGKTTMFYKLKMFDDLQNVVFGFGKESFNVNNFFLDTWDTGGGAKLRPLMLPLYKKATIIVYVIDSSDSKQMESLIVPDIIKLVQEPDLQQCKILFLANNCDKMPIAKACTAVVFGSAMRCHKWYWFNGSVYGYFAYLKFVFRFCFWFFVTGCFFGCLFALFFNFANLGLFLFGCFVNMVFIVSAALLGTRLLLVFE